jgi:hypothetical protein
MAKRSSFGPKQTTVLDEGEDKHPISLRKRLSLLHLYNIIIGLNIEKSIFVTLNSEVTNMRHFKIKIRHYKPKTCIDCKSVFIPTNTQAERCQTCSKKHTKEYQSEYFKIYWQSPAHKEQKKKYDLKYYSKHPRSKEYFRNYFIKRKYGLSEEEYNNLLKKQDGKCAICKTTDLGKFKTKRFYVDHDKTTGKVRGLLCIKCNTGLGMFKEDIKILSEAIEYLRVNKNVCNTDVKNPVSR